jgi:drug/metabolite transporter (DMT)-like permease
VDPAVVAIVLASAFLHAAWNALLKRQPDPEVAAAGVFLTCGAAGLAAALVEGRGFPSLTAAGYAAAAGLFEAGYIISLARALARAPLGPVYTLSRGGALIGVWPLSILLLGEHATALGLGGAALVLVGLALTGLSRSAAPAERSGLWWAAASAVNIAAYHICYKQALSAGGAPAAVFALSVGLAVPINLERLGAERRARLVQALRARPANLVVGGLLSCASFLILLVGLARAGAGAVLTLRNTSVLFAQGFAWLLGERPTRPRFLGALVVAAGAIVLGLG